MRTLLLNGGKFAGWNEATPQQTLLIFAVQQDDPHDQILRLTDEEANLRLGGSLGGCQALPMLAMLPDFFQRAAQQGQQGLAGLVNFMQHDGLALTQSLGLPFGQREEFAADSLMNAEIGEELMMGIHGLA